MINRKEQRNGKEKQPELIQHNFVAKHMHEVNKSQVFVDRKKNAKRGYSKHKQGRYSDDYRPCCFWSEWCVA